MNRSSATPSSTQSHGLPLAVSRARALTREIRELLKRRRADMAAVAHRLRAIQQGELYRALGYTSVYTYARGEHDFGKSKVTDLIGISRESEGLPAIREAFDGGGLDWTKAREITKIATPESERDWLQRAGVSTSEDLRDQRRGEPRRIRRGFAFSPQDAARFDRLLAGIQSERRGISDAEAVLILLERGASGAGGQAPLRRIVINECPACRLTTTESREGPVEAPASEVAVAQCSGEVHDLRDPNNPVKRAIPASVRRRVLDRDRRCLVPGCRALAGLDVHHEDGWKRGHHADRMLTLCSSHHRERHDGYLRIEGSLPELSFLGLDGRPYGARLPEVAHETSGQVGVADETSGQVGVAYETSADRVGVAHEASADRVEQVGVAHEASAAGIEVGGVADETSGQVGVAYETSADRIELRCVEQIATRGLRSLGMKACEASSLVRRVLSTEARESWTVEVLLATALRAA